MDEFLKAWSEMQWPSNPAIEYRIYYDSKSGSILDYTNDIREGTYITVDRDTFAKHRFDLRVVKGMLVNTAPAIGKLRPAEEGQACCPADITIIVDPTGPVTFWKNHTYDN